MPTEMRRGQFHVSLRPEHGGAFTHWRIVGSTPSSVPARLVARLIKKMAFWSGWPVELALFVNRETACWCEWWTEILDNVPLEAVRVRFVAGRQGSKGGRDG